MIVDQERCIFHSRTIQSRGYAQNAIAEKNLLYFRRYFKSTNLRLARAFTSRRCNIDRGKKFTIAISAAMSCKQLADFYYPLSCFPSHPLQRGPRPSPSWRPNFYCRWCPRITSYRFYDGACVGRTLFFQAKKKKGDICGDARDETISRKCSWNVVLRGWRGNFYP